MILHTNGYATLSLSLSPHTPTHSLFLAHHELHDIILTVMGQFEVGQSGDYNHMVVLDIPRGARLLVTGHVDVNTALVFQFPGDRDVFLIIAHHIPTYTDFASDYLLHSSVPLPFGDRHIQWHGTHLVKSRS